MTEQDYLITSSGATQEEYWVNTLPDGKVVVVIVSVYFRGGTFTISMTDEEKDEIVQKEEFLVNDYDACLDELWGGWGRDVEIQDIDKYTQCEKKDINSLIYGTEEVFDYEVFEENGWSIDNTLYRIGSIPEDGICLQGIEEVNHTTK